MAAPRDRSPAGLSASLLELAALPQTQYPAALSGARSLLLPLLPGLPGEPDALCVALLTQLLLPPPPLSTTGPPARSPARAAAGLVLALRKEGLFAPPSTGPSASCTTRAAAGRLVAAGLGMCLEQWSEPRAAAPDTPAERPCDLFAGLALKLVVAFAVGPGDVPAEVVARFARALLGLPRATTDGTRPVLCSVQPSPASVRAISLAVRLLLRLSDPATAPPLDHGDVLGRACRAGLIDLSAKYAAALGRPVQHHLVTLLVGAGEQRPAVALMARFGLEADFQATISDVQTQQVASLTRRGKLEAAEILCLSDTALKRRFLAELQQAGLAYEAVAYRAKLGMVDAFPLPDAMLARAEQAARAEYLALPPHVPVVWVHDAASLEEARALLLAPACCPDEPATGPAVLGLDCEWKPLIGNTTSSPVSILQVAGRRGVAIFDLLHDGFDPTPLIAQLFQDKGVVKVGFAFKSDLAMLRRTFPNKPGLHTVRSFVELRDAANLCKHTIGWGSSLSDLCSATLQRKLCKVHRLTDWSRRPLLAEQLGYAALDAHCQLELFDTLLPEASRRSLAGLQAERLLVAMLTNSQGLLESVLLNLFQEHAPERGAPQLGLLNLAPLDAGGQQPARAEPGTAEGAGQSRVVACLSQHREDAASLFVPHSRAALQEHQGAATLCALCASVPIVLVTPLGAKVDTARLAALLGVSRRSIKFASKAQCAGVFGHSPGSVPPLGHAGTFLTLVDKSLLEEPVILTGSGDPDWLLQLEPAALVAMTQALPLDLVLAPSASSTASLKGSGASAVTPRTAPRAVEPGTADDSAHHEARLFCADGMLKKLVRLLRRSGIDCACVKTGLADLVEMAKREGRTILTTSPRVCKMNLGVPTYLLKERKSVSQASEVVDSFGISLVPVQRPQRCAKCNSVFLQEVSREAVLARLPFLPADSGVCYWECQSCSRVTWRTFRRTFRAVVPGPRASGPDADVEIDFDESADGLVEVEAS